MSAGQTDILALPQYDNVDDIDYNELNVANQQLDRTPATFCTSATRPNTNLFVGRRIYETDTGKEWMWSGAAWLPMTENLNTGWISFAGTINAYTGMNTSPTTVAKTVNFAKYKIIGKTVFAQADVIFNATTTNGVGLSLPFTSKDRLQTCGNAALFGATTPADQCGIAYMNAAKDTILIVAYTNGFRDATSGAAFRYSVTYEIP